MTEKAWYSMIYKCVGIKFCLIPTYEHASTSVPLLFIILAHCSEWTLDYISVKKSKFEFVAVDKNNYVNMALF